MILIPGNKNSSNSVFPLSFLSWQTRHVHLVLHQCYGIDGVAPKWLKGRGGARKSKRRRPHRAWGTMHQGALPMTGSVTPLQRRCNISINNKISEECPYCMHVFTQLFFLLHDIFQKTFYPKSFITFAY